MSSVNPAMVVCVIDVTAASRLVANMLAHAVREPHWHKQSREEAPHAREDTAPPSHETRLSVSPAVDEGPSPPSSREYRAPRCPQGEGLFLGMASRTRPDLGRRFRDIWSSDNPARGLQDLGRRGVDGQSGRGVCAGGLTTFALQYRLASLTGALCVDGHSDYRRRGLLRSRRVQRSTVTRPQRDDVASRAALSARAPPRGQAE